jgi:hypothetical protein
MSCFAHTLAMNCEWTSAAMVGHRYGPVGTHVIHLLVRQSGIGQVRLHSILGDDQVVAMDRSRGSHSGQTGRQELQKSHLSCGVLTCDSRWSQLEIATSFESCNRKVRIVKVAINDLFRVGEWPTDSVKAR